MLAYHYTNIRTYARLNYGHLKCVRPKYNYKHFSWCKKPIPVGVRRKFKLNVVHTPLVSYALAVT